MVILWLLLLSTSKLLFLEHPPNAIFPLRSVMTSPINLLDNYLLRFSVVLGPLFYWAVPAWWKAKLYMILQDSLKSPPVPPRTELRTLPDVFTSSAVTQLLESKDHKAPGVMCSSYMIPTFFSSHQFSHVFSICIMKIKARGHFDLHFKTKESRAQSC